MSWNKLGNTADRLTNKSTYTSIKSQSVKKYVSQYCKAKCFRLIEETYKLQQKRFEILIFNSELPLEIIRAQFYVRLNC